MWADAQSASDAMGDNAVSMGGLKVGYSSE